MHRAGLQRSLRSRTVLLALASAAFITGASWTASAFAQPKPNLPETSSPDPRDLEGVWFKQATIDDPVARAKTGDSIARPPLPEMTPKAMAMYKARDDARASGHVMSDPQLKCAPTGVPLAMFLPYPFQIIQTPGQITLVLEHNHTQQIIHMDQKQPAKPPPATFMGHSVGHWEGDTLVVDTIAQRPENLLYPFLPMSAKTHVVERFRKIDGGKKLELSFTVDDPDLYPKPLTDRWEFLWWPRTKVFEYVCEENDHPEDEAAAGYHAPAYAQPEGAK
jgi:hypothetical protein